MYWNGVNRCFIERLVRNLPTFINCLTCPLSHRSPSPSPSLLLPIILILIIMIIIYIPCKTIISPHLPPYLPLSLLHRCPVPFPILGLRTLLMEEMALPSSFDCSYSLQQGYGSFHSSSNGHREKNRKLLEED